MMIRLCRTGFAPLLLLSCSTSEPTYGPEEEFIKHLAFSVDTGGLERAELPNGSQSAPRVVAPATPSAAHTVEPGGSLTFQIEWEGGAIEAINWSTGGHYYAVPVNARAAGEERQRVDLRASVRGGVCDHLDSKCHRIRYSEQAVSAEGAPGLPFQSYLWLDCAGAGCEEITPEPPPTVSVACTSGQTECAPGSSTQYRQCEAGGVWSGPRDCGANQACRGGVCGGTCRPGQTQCSSSLDRQTCDAQGSWGAAQPCENGCANGSCRNECMPGQTRCANERDVQTCEPSEQYGALTPCPNGCAADVCQQQCTPGATATCEAIEGSLGACAERVITCDADGTWPSELCETDAEEVCNQNADEDCDGQVNEEPECPPGFVSIGAGPGYNCAVTTSGGVSCWGLGGNLGEANDGQSTPSRTTPINVAGIANARSVASGLFGACAVRQDGTASCWGGNGNANGTPALFLALSDLQALVPGEDQTCALLENGTVQCCRSNPGPLITFESVVSGNQPLSGVESVDTNGGQFFCALLNDGTATCWGASFPGRPLDLDGQFRAVAVPGVQGARQVVTGQGHACALIGNDIQCWGSNSSGELGRDPLDTFSSDVPLAVDVGGSAVEAIDAADSFTCALLANGRVSCWGQLGTDNITPAPLEIGGITQAASLSLGQDHACVVRTNGTALCFGDNRFGQLGNGESTTGDEFGNAEFLPADSVLGP